MLHLLIAAALGGTYYSELTIPAAPPTDDGATMISVVEVSDVATGQDPQEKLSDWPWVSCGIAPGGSVYAIFAATKASWPSSIPDTATCTEGDETWVLDIVPTTNPTITTIVGRHVTFDLGPSVSTSIGIELRPDPWTPLPMPPFTATRSGAPWAGVKCGVGGNVLRVRVSDGAAGGTGHCAIDTSGGPVQVDITVIR